MSISVDQGKAVDTVVISAFPLLTNVKFSSFIGGGMLMVLECVFKTTFLSALEFPVLPLTASMQVRVTFFPRLLFPMSLSASAHLIVQFRPEIYFYLPSPMSQRSLALKPLRKSIGILLSTFNVLLTMN